ncbi:MAG: cobalt-precorrin 5A hydrolase [Methanobacteriaceae archaeon]
MKVAIISVTKNGQNLAKNLKEALCKDLTITKVTLFHKNVKSSIEECFNEYDFIIGIMSTGILIRSSCNLLKSKKTDPGIIAIDENGEYVISLVSGHLGGANLFSKKIAEIIGGNEVITTSTDTKGMIAIDNLAKMLYWDIEDTNLILDYNKAIINNKKLLISSSINAQINDSSSSIDGNTSPTTYNDISYLSNYLSKLDSNYSNYYFIYPSYINNKNIHNNSNNNTNLRGQFQVKTIEKNSNVNKLTLEINVLDNKNINRNNINNINSSNSNTSNNPINSINSNEDVNSIDIINSIDNSFKTMKIIPKNISIGIGSRKGISKDKIKIAINEACKNLNIPVERINRIGTGEMKKDEAAIIEIANDMGIPLDIILIKDLKNFFDKSNTMLKDKVKYSHSDFVMSKFGIPGLCEGAAMISAKNASKHKNKKAKLIHRKLAINGVTVAIAHSD